MGFSKEFVYSVAVHHPYLRGMGWIQPNSLQHEGQATTLGFGKPGDTTLRPACLVPENPSASLTVGRYLTFFFSLLLMSISYAVLIMPSRYF